MRQAKVIKEWRKLTIETIVQILEFTCDNNYDYAVCKLEDNSLMTIDIKCLQLIENPEPLSKETQAQAILFEGQCRLNAMLIDNKRGEIDNCSYFRFNYEDFDSLQEEIQRRINDLNKEK